LELSCGSLMHFLVPLCVDDEADPPPDDMRVTVIDPSVFAKIV
jgi:hypothetical protein